MSLIFPPAILGAEMAEPIAWAPGFFGSFCWKTPMPIKFLVLRGGGEGVKCQFIFMGVRIFPINPNRPRNMLVFVHLARHNKNMVNQCHSRLVTIEVDQECSDGIQTKRSR